MLRKIKLSILLLLYCSVVVLCQKETYFIFSNLEETIDKELFEKYKNEITDTEGKKYLISLGDNDLKSIEQLQSVANDLKVKLLTGDVDHQNLEPIKSLRDQKGVKLMTDGLYCPNPKIKEINDHNVFISINSNWFLDRDLQFKAKANDCITFNEADFFEELESIVEDYEDSNIFLFTHHTILSNTKLNGHHYWPYDLIPVIGNLYASHRRHIGRKQDMTSKRYKSFIDRMLELDQFKNVTVISGHDKINSIYKKRNLRSININSGNEHYKITENAENAKYQNILPSYVKLEINDEISNLTFINQIGRDTTKIIPKIDIKAKSNETSDSRELDYEPVAASKKYSSGKFTTWLMGSGYRKAWSTPVDAPLLFVEDQNLIPYARGGGGQTQSVKFKNQEKRKYAFRSLDKEPEKVLNEKLKNSIYKKVVQELITTMHPYAPLVVHELIKETDIYHIPPQLYIMGRGQSRLNAYKEFENKLGTLEEKPKGKGKNRKGYLDADKIVSTHQMLADLISDPDHTLDQKAYAKARVFDMYIGDWDKHEDNWKWALYKNKNGKNYIPIPKDRDHAFSKWTGFIPKAADFIAPAADNFDTKFNNLKQLNFQAYYLDRQLSTELNAQDWQDAVDYLNNIMTDSIIEASVKAFPPEVRNFYDQEIIDKLKARRKDLSRAINIHYCNISNHVNIAGSNKKDYFEIIRRENGNVLVSVYKTNKNGDKKSKYYEREFTPDITKKINCFGLDGKDIFKISGTTNKSINIRVIGGDDEDQVIDNSSVRGISKYTQVYDSYEEDSIENNFNEIKIKRPKRKPYYEPYVSIENTLLPLIPSIRKSPGNGWGLDFGFQYYTHEYNKPDFAQNYKFHFRYYPQIGAYSLNGNYRYKHFIGLTDFISSIKVSDEYDRFQYFYGVGSTTTFDDEARESGQYELDYDFGRYDLGLSKSIYGKSEFTNTILVEYHGIEAEERSRIDENDLPKNSFFFGYNSTLALDFTDQTNYPTDGNKFTAMVESRISSDYALTTNINTDISYYKSAEILDVKSTLAAKFGYQASFGEANFYHLSSLGSHIGLSGYTRNRFLDKYAAFYTTELRFDLGTLQTPIIPMQVGTFLIYDAGKVWNDNSSFKNNAWKRSYGIGFFITPYSTDYALSYSLVRSEDFKFYSQFQLGFSF